ncbi:MAG: hypothetical protein OEV30_05095, partial [Ignavibacteria bacterium]|nr:hypothetical protein [Ignavibacteria bacterium]
LYGDPSRTHQIGYATSGTWSPILKKNIALATIETGFSEPGTGVQIEKTVEHIRYTVSATVRSPQFFDPERKRSNPQGGSRG